MSASSRSGSLTLVALAALFGCQDGLRADQGLDAEMRVEGASFVRGEMPVDEGGPEVKAAFLGQTFLPGGFQQKDYYGALGAGSTAAAIALGGDRGWYIVPAGAPEPDIPDAPSFFALLSFSRELAPGPYTLLTWAVDADSRAGPAARSELVLAEQAPPEGELVFSLYWDTQSDLDLHVVIPDGAEVFTGDRNSVQIDPTHPGDPDAWKQGAILDFDSNADCEIDGRRVENVVWVGKPQRGKYLVRVDTASLCGQPAARFGIEVRLRGERVAEARGQSTEWDTHGPHGRGAGVLALELDLQ